MARDMTAAGIAESLRTSKSTVTVLAISVLLHTAVIVLLNLNLDPKRFEQASPAPIKARLLLPPVARSLAPPSKQPEKQKQALHPTAAPEDAIAREDKSDQRLDPNAEQTHTTSRASKEAESASSTTTPTVKISPGAALRDYMQRHAQETQERLAGSSARAFHQQKVSPEIVDLRKGMEMPVSPRPVQRINCQNALNEAFGLVSVLMGGTMKCTDRSKDLEHYIDARTDTALQR